MPSGQTAFDLIRSSLRLIGAISVGEVPTADEANDSLDTLNDLLETWGTETTAVFATDNSTFTLTGGKALYTIGPGADFNISRPVRISGAYCTLNGADFPISLIGEDDYNNISVKNSGSDVTQVLCYLNSFPNGIIKLWPVPASGTTLTLDLDLTLAKIPNLQQTISFPPAAYMALRYTLALLIAPEYGVEPSALVSAGAIKAMGDYKRTNRVRRTLKFDSALVDGPCGYSGLTSYVSGNSSGSGVPGPPTGVVLSGG